MASSGTWLFNPALADIVDEVFERCGIDPGKLTIEHIRSARRSMNLMLADWHARGVRQWLLSAKTLAVVPGVQVYTLPTGCIDIFHAVLRRNGVDVPLQQIGRVEYRDIPNKAVRARIDRFFVDRQRDQSQLFPWPLGDLEGDVIVYDALMLLQDAGGGSATPDIPRQWSEAFSTDLAWRIAEKFAPERMAQLKQRADGTGSDEGPLRRAMRADSENASTRFVVRRR